MGLQLDAPSHEAQICLVLVTHCDSELASQAYA